MSFMEENGTNSIFLIFSVRKSYRIVISEIVFSKNLILTKNSTAVLFLKFVSKKLCKKLGLTCAALGNIFSIT